MRSRMRRARGDVRGSTDTAEAAFSCEVDRLRPALSLKKCEERETMSTVKDPICGMTVVPERAAGKTVHDGKTEYFCSAACKQRFDASLARFTPAGQGKPDGSLVQLGSLKAHGKRVSADLAEAQKAAA